MVHGYGPLFECILFDSVDLNISLVPLERVQFLSDNWYKAVFDIVVDAHIGLNKVAELFDDIIGVLLEESLESTERLKLVEVLLEFCV